MFTIKEKKVMKQEDAMQYIEEIWSKSIVPTLIEYIKIPNKSPQFDPNWLENGFMKQAVSLIKKWCLDHAIDGMNLKVIQEENRTPLILIDIPGSIDETILLYGHIDKQPEMRGWSKGKGPWIPVLEKDRLYGRGSADDGYAVFAALSAIKLLSEQKIPHARCIILIEASEESGSPDLPFYIDTKADEIGTPSVVICLDSGCGNYDQLWITTSLRGIVSATLSIDVIEEGIHSGQGSGVVPSCFRILRLLLDRIENPNTGDILIEECYSTIPKKRLIQAEEAAKILGETIINEIPFKENVITESDSLTEILLRRTFKPALSVIGISDIPEIDNAGNVTLPSLKVKLSFRLPPTCDAKNAALAIKKKIEMDPPYQAHVKLEITETATGWEAPPEAEWLKLAADQASLNYFGKKSAYIGEGGSIPFMGMLGEKFPKAQFLITGVLGPGSNAHGPNEFLHLPTAKKLTAAIADIISAHAIKK